MDSKIGALRDRAAGALANARSGSLARGTFLLGAAEMGNRILRVLVGVVLARKLSTSEFGAIALVFTTFELVRIFIHNGLGARIIQSRDDELDEVCCAVDRINWVVGVIMFAVQLAVAWPTQYVFGANVAVLLAALSVVHLICPIGIARSCVAQRGEQHGFIAATNFFQITGENICMAACALAGFGVWSAVVPKVVIAIGNVAVIRAVAPTYRAVPVSRERLLEMFHFGRVVFATESLNTFRANADNLIVGKFLGIEAFGLYVFAFNNGSGIASGLASALGQAALPYMSKGDGGADVAARFRKAVAVMSLIVMPLIVLQVSLAPWYVPLIYGAKWTPAVPAVMLMSLGALSRPLIVATSLLLRITGAVALEWRMSQANALLFLVAIVGGLPFGVSGVAACVAIVNFLPAIAYARLALDTIPGARKSAPSANFAGARA